MVRLFACWLECITGLQLAVGARAQQLAPLTPTQARALTKDYATWYSYAYQHAPLACEFTPLDTTGNR